MYHEYYSYINQPKNARKAFRPKFVDNVLVFDLIKDSMDLKQNNLIIEYSDVQDILRYVKKATADLVQYAIRKTKISNADDLVPINGYKLFYHRRRKGFSHSDLSKATNIKRNHLTSLENVRTPKAAANHAGDIFRTCTRADVLLLEEALECPNQLLAGREDDLLSMYIQYYHANKGKSPTKTSNRN